jgi:hypothetical protein
MAEIDRSPYDYDARLETVHRDRAAYSRKFWLKQFYYWIGRKVFCE